MTSKPKNLILAIFLSIVGVFSLSSQTFAGDNSGEKDVFTPCGGAVECYTRKIGLTWVYVKFNEKIPGRKLKYGNINISNTCNLVGGVYMLLPFFHGNGDPGIRGYFGPIESLIELYEDEYTLYIRNDDDRLRGVEVGGKTVMTVGYGWTGLDRGGKYYYNPPIINSTAVSQGGKNRIFTIDGEASGYTLEAFGEDLNEVKRKYESIPVHLRGGAGAKEGWTTNSAQGWFCYDPNIADMFYSRSAVGLADQGENDMVISERDGLAMKTYTPPESGPSTIPVKFRHWIIADTNEFPEGLEVKYTVHQGSDESAGESGALKNYGSFLANCTAWEYI